MSVATKLPTEQIKILLVFDGNDEYCYPYRTFERETGLDRATLKKHMTELRQKGYVYYARGLMDEDGQVAGSGFGMESEKRDEVWEITHDTPEDKEKQLRETVDELILYAGAHDFERRKTAVNQIMLMFKSRESK